jgi:hypothetical protein
MVCVGFFNWAHGHSATPMKQVTKAASRRRKGAPPKVKTNFYGVGFGIVMWMIAVVPLIWDDHPNLADHKQLGRVTVTGDLFRLHEQDVLRVGGVVPSQSFFKSCFESTFGANRETVDQPRVHPSSDPATGGDCPDCAMMHTGLVWAKSGTLRTLWKAAKLTHVMLVKSERNVCVAPNQPFLPHDHAPAPAPAPTHPHPHPPTHPHPHTHTHTHTHARTHTHTHTHTHARTHVYTHTHTHTHIHTRARTHTHAHPHHHFAHFPRS